MPLALRRFARVSRDYREKRVRAPRERTSVAWRRQHTRSTGSLSVRPFARSKAATTASA